MSKNRFIPFTNNELSFLYFILKYSTSFSFPNLSLNLINQTWGSKDRILNEVVSELKSRGINHEGMEEKALHHPGKLG